MYAAPGDTIACATLLPLSMPLVTLLDTATATADTMQILFKMHMSFCNLR